MVEILTFKEKLLPHPELINTKRQASQRILSGNPSSPYFPDTKRAQSFGARDGMHNTRRGSIASVKAVQGAFNATDEQSDGTTNRSPSHIDQPPSDNRGFRESPTRSP